MIFGFRSNDVRFCIENVGFCIENVGFCIENVGFWQVAAGRAEEAVVLMLLFGSILGLFCDVFVGRYCLRRHCCLRLSLEEQDTRQVHHGRL